MRVGMAVLGTLALVAGGAYLLVLGGLYLGQSQLLYLPDIPSRELTATPEVVGLPYESLRLPTRDGETLHAWYLPANPGTHTLAFFHGNAGNLSHRLDNLELFHQLGLNVLIIDYRGYGASSGQPSEVGTSLDAEAAWSYLTSIRGLPPERILLYGHSLGGAVAVQLASEVRAGGLIVESSFTSVADLAAELYPWVPARWLVRFHYDSRSKLSQVRSPVLIIHSRDDEIIPYHHGQSLYAAAPSPKRLLDIQGDHNSGFLISLPRYLEGWRSWLGELPKDGVDSRD